MQARLDTLDRQLLALLQANARAPTAELARRLKVARTTVVARIARLEREGVVGGYGVRLGRRLEESAVRAFCGLSVQARSAAVVIKALERMPEVEGAWAVSGEFDYMVQLRCDSPQDLDALLDQLGQIEGVRQTQTSMVLSQKIDRRPTDAFLEAIAGEPT
ncbi:MAG: Lrp/AsnC family transcriptional regulator [Proteobacteria bacterium]|nr:Lrp/AsnC family transcriptional regulator [Pseudomonadota bacterium]